MRPMDKLSSQGFVVLHGVIGEDAANTLRIIARRSHLPWENEDPTSPAMRRVYASVPSEPSSMLTSVLEPYYRTFFPNVNTSAIEWNYLKSYGGAPDQSIRRNFTLMSSNPNPMDATAFPGSLLLATQDDTVIYGFGWNHQVAFQSNKKAICLRKGDMLLFRGDLIHARSGYAWKNLCVHTYLGTTYTQPQFFGQLIPLYENKPAVDDYDCRCYVWGCTYQGRSKRALSKHLSSSHNFVTKSPRMRAPDYDPRAAAVEDEYIELNALRGVEPTLAFTFIINCARGHDNTNPTIADDSITGSFDSTDMEMEILVAVDSDSETETESFTSVTEEVFR